MPVEKISQARRGIQDPSSPSPHGLARADQFSIGSQSRHARDLAPEAWWLLFQVGKRPPAFSVYARTWILSGAEDPRALLFHIGTAMRFPQVRQPRVNSVVGLTGALGIYTGASEGHPV